MSCINLNHIQAKTLINAFIDCGIMSFNTSPGLRNAPLLGEIKQISNSLITTNFDERAAGFRALAQAKLTGMPSVLMCTSGTAMANYFPAVIEAYFQEVPIIIVSSDRPQKNIDALSNQSIYQEGLFGKYCENKLSIDTPSVNTSPASMYQSVKSFLHETIQSKRPSHINISFLDPANKEECLISTDKVKALLNEFEKINRERHIIENKDTHEIPALKNIEAPDLISIGEFPIDTDPEIKKSLEQLIRSTNTMVTIDVTSQMKYQNLNANNVIPSLDHPEVSKCMAKRDIKVVWHFGKRMTSKHYYRILESKQTRVICFNNSQHVFNPSFSEISKFPLNLNSIAQMQTNITEHSSTLPTDNFDDIIRLKRDIIESNDLSFPLISKKLIEEFIQPNDLVVLGNSTSIRSFDFYSHSDNNKNCSIYTHRGASGIEGFLAALKGIDDTTENKRVVAILGDISFLHDLNSLFLFKELKNQIHLFLVNDNGGGIFRLLNIEEMKNCQDEMITPHGHQFSMALTEMFKHNEFIEVNQVDNTKKLQETFQVNYSNNKLFIHEVILDKNKNNKVYQCLRTIQA